MTSKPKEGRRPNPDQFLISTKIHPHFCVRCKRWVYQATVRGFTLTVEPTAINLRQELELRLMGVRIFQTFSMGGGERGLEFRGVNQINAKDFGYTIHAQHDCNRLHLEDWQPEDEVKITKPTTPEEPPF